MLHKPNFACSSSLLRVTKVLLNAVFDLFNKTCFFRQRNFIFSLKNLFKANFGQFFYNSGQKSQKSPFLATM